MTTIEQETVEKIIEWEGSICHIQIHKISLDSSGWIECDYFVGSLFLDRVLPAKQKSVIFPYCQPHEVSAWLDQDAEEGEEIFAEYRRQLEQMQRLQKVQ